MHQSAELTRDNFEDILPIWASASSFSIQNSGNSGIHPENYPFLLLLTDTPWESCRKSGQMKTSGLGRLCFHS